MWWISKPTNTLFFFLFLRHKTKKNLFLLCLIISPNQTRERPASITSPEIRLYSHRKDWFRWNSSILIIFAPSLRKWTCESLNNWGFSFQDIYYSNVEGMRFLLDLTSWDLLDGLRDSVLLCFFVLVVVISSF